MRNLFETPSCSAAAAICPPPTIEKPDLIPAFINSLVPSAKVSFSKTPAGRS